MRQIFQNNLEASTQIDFVERIVREILKTGTEVFRLHVVGDFYSVEYVERWMRDSGQVAWCQVLWLY